MKSKVTILGNIVVLLFFAAILGKQSGIAWLSASPFQIGTTILLSLAESIGILLCLKLIVEGGATFRNAVLPLLLFTTLYLLILGTYLLSLFWMPKLYAMTYEAAPELVIPKYLNKLYQGDPKPEKQMQCAAAIYDLYGITVPYQNGDAGYSLYEPTQKDLKSWKEMQSATKSGEESLKVLGMIYKQSCIMCIIYLSSFFSVLLIGTIAIALKRKPTPPTQSP